MLAGRTINGLAQGSCGYHTLVLYGASAPPVIKLEVLEPVAVTLTNSDSTVEFGTTYSGGSVRTFRISNNATDSLPLQALNLSLSGIGAGAFSILDSLPAVLRNGEYVNVRIALTGPTTGDKNAVLTLTSNGGGVAPFNIALTGNIQTNISLTLTSANGAALELSKPDLSASTLNLTLNFAPPTGTQFTIIKKTDLPFITSMFSNVPNGATINLSYNGTTYPFVAWYYGGDGNDLVLLWP